MLQDLGGQNQCLSNAHANDAVGACMKITTLLEGHLWKLAVGTLGAERLEQLVADLLRGYVKTHKFNMYGFLRLEWVGHEALEALRKGQRLAGAELAFYGVDPTNVAVLDCHCAHCCAESSKLCRWR